MIEGKELLTSRVIYTKPNLKEKQKTIQNIVGLDTEAYTSGEPFMFCTSHGEVLLPKDIPEVFFEPRYVNANFMLYNIKYDSGALLYHLPADSLRELWDKNETCYEGIKYEYLPKKLLKISKSHKEIIYFWDIAQFYKMSLDSAAQTYLGEGKRKIQTKRFTHKYVERFFHSISEYCIRDAVLTEKLGVYLVNKLAEFGIKSSKLYSCASISFKYFCENSRVITAWRFWKQHKKLLIHACDAYEGGKFEVTVRGFFSDAYEYDITSAYPYEIANLVDISKASVIYSPEYQKKAVYGYLRCRIRNPEGKHLPCGIKNIHGVRVYPAGEYHLTITKGEYDYLREIGIEATILDGVWLTVRKKRYPYRNCIKKLFAIKDKYKGKDKMLYYVTKIVMNSFYGKMAQCVEKTKNDTIVLGRGWNPMYAAEVTANTRIKVCRIQNEMGRSCFAVHTDSVITDRPIPSHYIKQGVLGAFEFVERGSGVIIACGMYQIKDSCAFKGFVTPSSETWLDILKRYGGYITIPYWMVHVESWIEAMAKNHDKAAINVFSNIEKKIDLNCDVKRIWFRKVRSKDLLDGPEYSEAKLHIETEQPKIWQKSS